MRMPGMEARPGPRRGGIAVLGTAGDRRWAAGRGADARRVGADERVAESAPWLLTLRHPSNRSTAP